ncbi:MAG: LamG domain-containing protein [Candidatus Cloacimonetes bacterium]|nr:LamG domain-containing protein [Candidatus Cloacimonadota bacterium]
MGRVNLLFIVFIIAMVGSNLTSLNRNLNKLNDAIDHSLLTMEQDLLGGFALNYGILKLSCGDVKMAGEDQVWETPGFLLSRGEIDSICYVAGEGDTVEVIPYIRNWQGNSSIASNSRALLDFFITQPEDQFAYYMMDEGSGTTLTDSSGLGFDGTMIDMDDSNWVPSVNGTGLTFDGNDDYVDLGNAITGEYDDNLTVAAWVQMLPDSPVEWGNIITENSDNLGNQLTGFTLRVKGKYVGHPYLEFEFEVTTLNGKEKVNITVHDWEMDLFDWHFIAGILDMDNQLIMVGVVDEDKWAIANITASGMPVKDSLGPITIGHIVGAPNGQGRKSGITGSLDSMRTIADVMTIDQLLQLMLYDGIKVPKIIEWSS